ncbi:MAG TPA: MBL fold metallo-hydrolase [Actinobacteria bacterium]|nr:ribonuclease Z [bacterium BMS3Bbin01]HDH27069.1 MBL fold metallo-hydrolase [Actinomycetota bacterium]
MRLTVLGSNGTFSTPGRPTSGYLIRHADTRIWVDTGPGTFAALQTVIDYRTIDAVVVTHVHADHSVDLFGFYHAVKYGPDGNAPIPVFCPEGLQEQVTCYLGGPEHDPAGTFDFRICDDGSAATVGSIGLKFSRTDHGVPTLAVRAEADGRVLVYSSDTGPAGDWARLAERADLFVCEATYQGAAEDKPWPQHLTAAEAGEIARGQVVDKLMITHIWPFLDPGRSVTEAEATFGRPVGLAVPGMTVKV